MKKRPLCIVSIFYIIGIIIGLYLKISIAFLICIFIILLIITYNLFKNKKYILLMVVFLFGFLSINLIDYNYANIYREIQENEKYYIEAIIISDVIEKDYKYVYEIEIQQINKNKKYKGNKWLLNIKKSEDITNKLQYGDLIAFNGIFDNPSVAKNYKGFDYQKYLKTQKIYGNVTCKEKVEVLSEDEENFLSEFFHRASNQIKEKIYSILPENIRGICIGILIGERKDINEEIIQDFRNSNLMHMLAISGAHISYIVSGISIVLTKVKYQFKKIFTIIFLVFFMSLTGFTPSVQRASIMCILILISSLLHRKSDVYTNLSFSILIILICNPYTICDIGFQLSYGGTIGIVLFYERIKKWLYLKLGIEEKLQKQLCINNEKIVRCLKRIYIYILDMLIVTFSANLTIIPIMAMQFNTVSLTFWISNILAGPFLGVITIYSFITYFISIVSLEIAMLISIPLKYIIHLFILIANICSKIPFSSIFIKTPYIYEIVIYYLFLISILNLRKIKERIYNKLKIIVKQKFKVISIILIILISSTILNFGFNKNLKIYFVDVGQGDCTLICTPTNKVILIDGGGSENSSFDVGKQTLFPYLLDRRINKIDYVMISHFDSDHVGGLFYILENMKVNNVIISKQGEISENYKRFKELVEQKDIRVILVKQGDKVIIDKYCYFDILFPTDNLITENTLNNNSIVAKLKYYHFSMLFTGDIEEIAEKELITTYMNSDKLNATILKVAHHGSKSSSIKEMLELIKPKLALIGVGEKNTFGHPNDGVLNRLKSFSTRIYRTDIMGEIIIEVNKNGRIKVKTK